MHNVSRPVNRERKSSKRVVYLRATGKDSNSVKHYCLTTSEIGVRAHCYEEGSVRGAFQSGANFRDPLVDTRRRARERPAFFRARSQSRWYHRVCDEPSSSDVFRPDSLVRNRDTGCRAEMSLFATVPVPNGPKLSDSLVHRGS